MERNLHSIYEHRRTSGEWFALNSADVAYIQKCAAGNFSS
jgi:hypothetical protein